MAAGVSEDHAEVARRRVEASSELEAAAASGLRRRGGSTR